MLFCKVEDPGDIGSVKNFVTSGIEINGEKKPTMILKMMLTLDTIDEKT